MDKDIQERESVTVLRCDCGGIETVYDQPDDERAMDEAERIHAHVQTCLLCLEPLQDTDLSPWANNDCRLDDPEGLDAAIADWMERSFLDEFLKSLADGRIRRTRYAEETNRILKLSDVNLLAAQS